MDEDAHRQLGIDLFNETWRLLETVERTPEQEDELVHCAHASAYHWLRAGTAANRARSEWLCSRVYATLGRSASAVRHARRCLALVEGTPDEMEDWDVAAAHEALARAHLVAGEHDAARVHVDRARAAVAAVVDEEDRVVIEADVAALAELLDGAS
jgi:hypothetical protein